MHTSARRAVAVLLTLFGALLLVGVAPAGPAQGRAVTAADTAAVAAKSDCNYPVGKCACPSLSVSTTVPDVGEAIEVTGANFEPKAVVALVLKPVRNTRTNAEYRLGSILTNTDGAFKTTVVMPKEAIGTYDIHAVGARPDSADEESLGCPADPTQRLRIGGNDTTRNANNDPSGGGASNGPDDTAFTGFNMLWLLLLAVVLIALGVYAVRRGRTRHEVVRSIHG